VPARTLHKPVHHLHPTAAAPSRAARTTTAVAVAAATPAHRRHRSKARRRAARTTTPPRLRLPRLRPPRLRPPRPRPPLHPERADRLTLAVPRQPGPSPGPSTRREPASVGPWATRCSRSPAP